MDIQDGTTSETDDPFGDWLNERLRAGFTTFDDLVVDVEDRSDDFGLDPADAVARVRAAWAALLAVQASWTRQSDSDRLDAAFAELEATGIVARMNFTCCGTCGHSEIHDEVPAGGAADGYVFFHAQDSDGLYDGLVHLAYGPFGEFADDASYSEAAVLVGSRVVRCLRSHGFRCEWNGLVTARIRVFVPDWRRRLPVGE